MKKVLFFKAAKWLSNLVARILSVEALLLFIVGNSWALSCTLLSLAAYSFLGSFYFFYKDMDHVFEVICSLVKEGAHKKQEIMIQPEMEEYEPEKIKRALQKLVKEGWLKRVVSKRLEVHYNITDKYYYHFEKDKR